MFARGGAVSLRQPRSIQHPWVDFGEQVLHGPEVCVHGARELFLVGGSGSPDSLASSDHEEHLRCHRPRKDREPHGDGQLLPVGCFGGRSGPMQPIWEGLGGVSIHSIDHLTPTTTTPLQPAFNSGSPLLQQPRPPLQITLIAVCDCIPSVFLPGLPSLCSQIDTTGDNGSGFGPSPVQDLSPGSLSPSAHTGQFFSFCDFGQDGDIDFDLPASTGDYTPTLDSWQGLPPPTQPAPSPFPQPTPQPTPQLSPTDHSLLFTPSSGTSLTSHSFLFEPSSDTSLITTQTPNSPHNDRFSCPTCDKVFPTKVQVS